MAFSTDWEDYRRGFYESTAELFWDRDFDIDDYESMSYYSDKPIVGGYASSHKQRLENEELDRWKDDYKKYTGADTDKSRYPIRKGLYNRPGDSWDLFDDSRAVLDMYSNLNRWL